MGLPPHPSRRQTSGTKSSAGDYSRGAVVKSYGYCYNLRDFRHTKVRPIRYELPDTRVRKLFLKTLNTRSSFILLQLLDLLSTLAAFRMGGLEVNPLVATLTIHFGRVGGVVLSKLIAVLLMLGVRRRLWMVNLVYIGVICWNLVVVISLSLHRR